MLFNKQLTTIYQTGVKYINENCISFFCLFGTHQEYYTKLLVYDEVFIEQYDHYVKQTYRNRCTIAAPDGELILSIPTVKPDTQKCLTRDMRTFSSSKRHALTSSLRMPLNLLTTIHLSLNITKTISDLSTKRNMNF